MELGWIPDALEQIRLLCELAYEKSEILGHACIILTFAYPIFLIFALLRYLMHEKPLNDKVKLVKKNAKMRLSALNKRGGS